MQDGSSAEEMLEAPLLGDGYAFNVLGMEIKKCDVLKTNKKSFDGIKLQDTKLSVKMKMKYILF